MSYYIFISFGQDIMQQFANCDDKSFVKGIFNINDVDKTKCVLISHATDFGKHYNDGHYKKDGANNVSYRITTWPKWITYKYT